MGNSWVCGIDMQIAMEGSCKSRSD